MLVMRAGVGTSAPFSVLSAVRCCGQLESHGLVPKYSINTVQGGTPEPRTNRRRPREKFVVQGHDLHLVCDPPIIYSSLDSSAVRIRSA